MCFLLFLQGAASGSSGQAAAAPSWNWVAAWAAIGATLAAALAAWIQQTRNRTNSIRPKIAFYPDPAADRWMVKNFGQGSADNFYLGALNERNQVQNYIKLRDLPKDETVLVSRSEFPDWDVLAAKYTDINGQRYFSVYRNGQLQYPKRDPYPEWSRMNARDEAEWQGIQRSSDITAALERELAAAKDEMRLKEQEIAELKRQPSRHAPTPLYIDGVRWKRGFDGRITSPLDGRWLERIKRLGEWHYSIFRFQFDANARVDPFRMEGDSFRWNGEKHSDWHTQYMRIEFDGSTVRAEYIYSASLMHQEAKRGYGVSVFKPEGGDELTVGDGHYLAGEEVKPYRCEYRLQRIDEHFRIRIRAEAEPLDTIDSMQRFVQLAHRYYEGSPEFPISTAAGEA